MNAVSAPALRKRRTDAAVFEPKEALNNDARADAVIDLAKRVGDWPLLEQAIDKKLDDQDDFVNWWKENVGKGRPKSNGDRDYFSVDQAHDMTGITQPQVSKWAKRLAKRDEYRAALYGTAYRKAMGELLNNFRAQASGKQEWYTPAEYIEAARDVMGAIDLDPASSDYAQRTVKATEYFTAQRSSLAVPWHGRVFLNPPYAADLVSQFVEKLKIEVIEGRVSQAILLVNNCTDTAWFHIAARAMTAVCFPAGRISFVNPDGESTSPTQGQCFFYFGAELRRFVEVFSAHGIVMAKFELAD